MTQPPLSHTAPPAVRVLIAENEAALAYTLRRQLEGRGLSVVAVVSNGVEAVARARELHPEVVLMDIDMPRLDGVLATRLIMEDRPTIIVMLTALTGRDVTTDALAAGAMRCLGKPAGVQQMVAAIEAAQHDFKEFELAREECGSLEEALAVYLVIRTAKRVLAPISSGQAGNGFQKLQELAAQHGVSLAQAAREVVSSGSS